MNLALVMALSLLQGITEFLPISSSGHLRIAHYFFGEHEASTAQDVILHLATLLSVFWVFRGELVALLKPTGGNAEQSETPGFIRTATLVVVGTIPAGVAGVFGGDSIESLTSHLNYVGYAYLGNAGILWVAHTAGKRAASRDLHQMTVAHAFFIGLAQSVAIIRGISRSGSTITAALCLGYSASSAALFSFLLAIPAIGGAAFLQLLPILRGQASYASTFQADPLELFLTFVLTFFIGIGALRVLLVSAKKSLWWPYAIYSILLGFIAIFMG